MAQRTIALDPGSPEWTVHQQLDTLADDLRRSLVTILWDTDFGYYMGIGMVFIHRCITTTSVYDRQMLDNLLLRCIGSAAVLNEQANKTTEPKEEPDATIARQQLTDLIADLHVLRLKLPELHIQRTIDQFQHTTKESTQ